MLVRSNNGLEAMNKAGEDVKDKLEQDVKVKVGHPTADVIKDPANPKHDEDDVLIGITGSPSNAEIVIVCRDPLHAPATSTILLVGRILSVVLLLDVLTEVMALAGMTSAMCWGELG